MTHAASTLELAELLRLHVRVLDPISAGATPGGEVRVVPFEGGSFEGHDLRGSVCAGGSDWQRVRNDGVLEIRARYMLESDRGERIEVLSEGLRHAPPGVLERIASGEAVPADAYYFRTAIRMQTAAPRLAHLNRTLMVAVGERSADEVSLIVYSVP